MKKQLLLGSVLLAAISAFSQTGYKKPKGTGLINTKLIAGAKFGGNETAAPVAQTAQSLTHKSAKANAVNTWQSFTSSMNIYGSVISYCKPLQWNDELDAVSFIHRKSPSYPTTNTTTDTESGSIVAMISTNCGTTWDSTLVYADPTHRGRYPQGAIYNAPGNTNINNAHIVANGPITHGSGWVGNFYASKQLGTANYNSALSTDVGAQQYFSAATGPFTAVGKHDFAAYSFSSTDDGKVRALGTVAQDINNLTTGKDSAIMIVTGTYNSTNNTFDWAGHVIDPPTHKDPTGERQWVSRPMMAWNDKGDVGYVMVLGSRKNATGSNVGMQPIVYKTVNYGATWTLEPGIDFNLPEFADVKRSIITVSTDNTLEVPFFNWLEGMDCSVDANNKLHLFSTIVGSVSNDPDSAGWLTSFGTEGYRWPHTPGSRPYLYDFIYDGTNATPKWSHITIDSMSTEGPAAVTTGNGYNYNPWDPDPLEDNQKVRVDARLQMSRTPDGKYVVFTWTESDTGYTDDQTKWNHLPDIKARVLNVTTGVLNDIELDVTAGGAGEVAGHAMYHFVSPKCKFISDATTGAITGPVLRVPMTVSNSAPYQQKNPNTHWYSCATLDFTRSTVGVAEHALNSTNASFVYPNPAKNNAMLSINLSNNSKVQIDVLNTVGQVVKTTRSEGQIGSNNINFDLSGLASGIYLVNVKVDNASSTKKLIIE